MRVPLDMGACGIQEVAFFHQHSDGVDFVFVDHPSYHRAGVLPRHGHADIAIQTAVLWRIQWLGRCLGSCSASTRNWLVLTGMLCRQFFASSVQSHGALCQDCIQRPEGHAT